MFFLRPHRELVVADGVRAGLEWEEVVRIDGMVKLLLEVFDVPYIPVESLSMQERVRLVERVLDLAGLPQLAAAPAADHPRREWGERSQRTDARQLSVDENRSEPGRERRRPAANPTAPATTAGGASSASRSSIRTSSVSHAHAASTSSRGCTASWTRSSSANPHRAATSSPTATIVGTRRRRSRWASA